MMRLLAGAAILVVAAIAGFAWLGFHSRRMPGRTGLHGGSLLPCPASPNCVVSRGGDAAHVVEPLRFDGDPAAAMRRLRDVLAGLPGATLATESSTYLRAEVRSRLFGFVDDVECLLDAAGGRIDIRSASRVGYGDMGANRARALLIKSRFERPPG